MPYSDIFTYLNQFYLMKKKCKTSISLSPPPNWFSCSSTNLLIDNFQEFHSQYGYFLKQIYDGILYSIPIIVVSVTFERYLNIVKATSPWSMEFLESRKRVFFHIFITIAVFLCPLLRVADLLIARKSVCNLYFKYQR